MWQAVDNKLYQKFTFKDFKEAVSFLNQVAEIANELNHHPTIHNTYSTVELWLSTHEAGDKITAKDNQLADRISLLLHEPIQTPTTTVTEEIKLYADGGSRGNPGPSASGYVLMDMADNIIHKSGVYLGITTNNQAEYQALRFGLEEAQKLGASIVNVYMDSLLVINQMKGIFKVRNQDLLPIHQAIKELNKNFSKIVFTHVPRELNKLADAEVNITLDSEAQK